MRLASLAFVLVLVCSATSYGQVTISQVPEEWREAGISGEALARSEYQRFLAAAPGQWQAEFDPVLKTPRAIHGSGVELVPSGVTQDRVELEALRFLNEHASLFGAESGDFVLDGTVFNRDLWIVVVTQRYMGIPVHGSHLSLAIRNGRLILVQGATYPVEGIDPFPRLGRDEAKNVAQRKLGLGEQRAGKMKDFDQARAVILPRRRPGAVDYRLAWEVTIKRENEQRVIDRHIIAYVDALNGDVLAAYDGNRYEHFGTTSIEVEQRTVGGLLETVAAPFLDMTIAGAALQTDVDGAFSVDGLTGPQPVTALLRGALASVTNAQGANASFAGTIDENTPFSLLWDSSNSDPSERMSYLAIVESNRFVRPLFPSLAWLDTTVPAVVNLNDQCNAFFDGTGVNMFRGGSVCNATGRIFDIVAHEWGHGLDLNLPGGLIDVALSEFIADMVAFTQTDDHLIGPGFFVGGGALRNLQSSFVECFDASVTQVHDAGQMLGAVVWDIREDLKATGMSPEDLKRAMLLPIALAQTRSEWYLGMLAVDDDDGNLANGTPNGCLIYRQFDLHSCGADRWPGIPAKASPSASPAVLFPPNHKMVPVTISMATSDPCSAGNVCRVTSVTSNEPVNGPDDGNTSPDWVISGMSLLLRAERSGSGSGRIYTVTVECIDTAGGISTSNVTVTVPRVGP